MKKVFVFVLTVVMVFTMASAALANKSIDALKPILVDVNAINKDGNPVEVAINIELVAVPQDNWNPEIAALVEADNNPEVTLSVADAVAVASAVSGEVVDLGIDLSEADFASGFSSVMLDDPNALAGEDVKIKITVIYKQLKDRNVEDFVILLIDPMDGRVAVIPLIADDFNPETCEVTFELPFFGIFALVEK